MTSIQFGSQSGLISPDELGADRSEHQGLSAAQLLQGQQRALEMVARGETLHSCLRTIASFSEQCLPEMLASILYYDPQEEKLRRGGYGRLPDGFQEAVDGLVPGPQAGSCGTCAFRAQRVISEDVFEDPLWEGFHEFCRGFGIRSAWSSPLISPTDQSLLGVFGMYYPDRRVPSAADLTMVDHMTHLATLACERHRRDEERRRQAWQDALTGLGNRHLLQARAGELIREARANQLPLSLVFLDLDHFKLFNDNFGHLLGDKLLQKVSRRLATALEGAPLLVRFGGDEFVAMLPETALEASGRLRELASSFRDEALLIDQVRAQLSFSSGVVDLADVNWDMGQAIVQADTAARSAKEQGRNRVQLVDNAQLTAVQRRLQVGQQLDAALQYGLIEPHAQPIIELRSGMPLGAELLFRAQSGVLEGISPALCIAVAEENGLIDAIGLEMLRGACRLLKQPPLLTSEMVINVNLSVYQLMREPLANEVEQLLDAEGIPAQRICLEITESRWLDPDGPSRRLLLRLLDLGFQLALDDFGTGYASLVLLRALPFRHVKVDQSFVRELVGSAEARALCRAMLEMGKACNVNVTAEGVETEEQRQILLDMGYLRAQGYLFARPEPLAAVPALMQRLLRQASGSPADFRPFG